MLTQDEHGRISEAIKAAERETSGEIHCVVCGQSDDYFLAAGFVLACMVMAMTLLVGWLSFRYWLDIGAVAFSVMQICAFLAGLAIIRVWPALRIRLVPKSLRYRRAHGHAARQFLARNIHATEARTGVLIFVSLAERYAEIIADDGLSVHIDQTEWDRMITELTAGIARGQLADALIETVRQSGALLARHFPAGPDDRNELPDHVVEI